MNTQNTLNMVKFNQNGKQYACKQDFNSWSLWVCVHEDGSETWAKVSVPSSKLKLQDVIDNVERVDTHYAKEILKA